MDGSRDDESRARPRLALVALGCRVNRAEVDALASAVGGGFEVVGEGEPADYVVVNTCAITADADSAARQAIRRAAREHPDARILATGCYAEVARDLVGQLPNVALVVGPALSAAVPRILARLHAGDDPETALARGAAEAPRWAPPTLEAYAHARPLLKVQDGCDARCAYCVVPFARGSSRSKPFEETVADLVAMGERHAEVVVTGVHLGAFGKDLEPARSLADVLREAVARGFSARLRLSSIEPGELPLDVLLDADIARVLCEHFHLPLQSGSPRVLRAMGRPTSPGAYRDAVEQVAALVPGACIGTDLLVGFPGETDEDHRATVALVEKLPLAYLHVFPFSPRPGTRAADLPDPVPGPVARARTKELLAVSERRWRAFLAAQAGHELEAVVERVEGGLARGTSRQYATVRWPASGERRGAVARVRVEASDRAECYGVRASTFTTRLPP